MNASSRDDPLDDFLLYWLATTHCCVGFGVSASVACFPKDLVSRVTRVAKTERARSGVGEGKGAMAELSERGDKYEQDGEEEVTAQSIRSATGHHLVSFIVIVCIDTDTEVSCIKGQSRTGLMYSFEALSTDLRVMSIRSGDDSLHPDHV